MGAHVIAAWPNTGASVAGGAHHEGVDVVHVRFDVSAVDYGLALSRFQEPYHLQTTPDFETPYSETWQG